MTALRMRSARWMPVLLLGLAASLQAAPKLRLSSAAVGPVSIAQGGSTSQQTVEAYNAGDGNLNLQVTSSAPWLSPSVGTSRGCTTQVGTCLPINIAFNTSALARGTFTGLVTVTDPAALDAPQNISVTVQIGGGVPDQVNLFVAPNGSSDEVRFSTNNLIGTTPNTTSGGPWLSVALDGTGTFRFVVPYRISGRHLEGMPEGTYSGSITVIGSNVAAENKNVPVTMRVTSEPILRYAPQDVSFRIAAGAAVQQAFVSASNGGLGTLNISGVTATTVSGGNWLTAEVSNNLITVKADAATLSAGSYTGSLAINSNAVNGTATVPVRLDVVAPAAPLTAFGGVLNSGNFDAGLAPGGVAALFGEQLSYQAAGSGTTVPLVTELGGVRVLVNDVPAPLYFSSYNQVNFQIPYETPTGEAVIRVERGGERGNGVAVKIDARAPRIIQIGDSGVIVNQDGSLAIAGGRPTRPGEAITIYCVGLGATNPGAVTGAAAAGAEPLARITPAPKVILGNAFTGARVLDPIYIGLTPTAVGLYQVNVIIPDDIQRGNIQIYLEGDGYRSNSVLLPIQ